MTIIISLLLSCGEKSNSPDIVIITIDTLRADRLGYRGYDINTPNIDGLAEKGQTFNNARTCVPLTLPAHASLFTGCYPFSHGVRNNGIYYLSERFTTLPEIFKSKGYDTAAFIGAYVLNSKYGLSQGFDYYDDNFSNQSDLSFNYAERTADKVIDSTLDWLKKEKTDQPFFIWIHLFDPHAPYRLREKFVDKYGETPYDAEVAYVDEQLGRFFTAISNLFPGRDRITVLTADHGEALGEQGEETHGFFLYDGTMRIPLIINYKGKLQPGKSDSPVNIVDIMPTILELCNFDVPPDLDGKNIFNLSEDRIQYGETYLPYQNYGWSSLESVTKNKWKYISSVEAELYNLDKDKKEKYNVLNENKTVAETLKKELKKITDCEIPLQSALNRKSLTGDEQDKLKSLGYIFSSAPVRERLKNPKEMIDTYKELKKLEGIMEEDIRKFSHSVSDDIDRGAIALEEMIKKGISNTSIHSKLLVYYLKTKNYPSALRHGKAAIAIDPLNFTSNTNLATVYRDMKNYTDALYFFGKAEELMPSDSMVHWEMARIYDYLRQNKEALDSYQKYLKIAPYGDNAGQAYFFMAEIYRTRLNDKTEALKYYNKSLAITENKTVKIMLKKYIQELKEK